VNMLLLYYEGVGFILGFAVGHFGKSYKAEYLPKRKRVYHLVAAGFLVIGVAVGLVWGTITHPGVRPFYLGKEFLGVLALLAPGWAFGMFGKWLVERFIQGK